MKVAPFLGLHTEHDWSEALPRKIVENLDNATNQVNPEDTAAPFEESPAVLSRGERFSRLLLQHQRKLHIFICILVNDHNHADDILQEVAAVLWRKFDQYEEDTNFYAWAKQTARYCILQWRRKQSRNPMPLSEKTIQLITEESLVLDELEDRCDALRGCMKQLSERDQSLLKSRYEKNISVSEIAEAEGLSRRGIYKQLKKVHSGLLLCIREKLAAESLA